MLIQSTSVDVRKYRSNRWKSRPALWENAATLIMYLAANDVTDSSAIVETIDLYSCFWSKYNISGFSRVSIEHSLPSILKIFGSNINFLRVSSSIAVNAFSNRADTGTTSHSPYSPERIFKASFRNTFGIVSTDWSFCTILLSVDIIVWPLTSFDCQNGVDFGWSRVTASIRMNGPYSKLANNRDNNSNATCTRASRSGITSRSDIPTWKNFWPCPGTIYRTIWYMNSCNNISHNRTFNDCMLQ